jgi:hypothetical protein
VRLSSDELLERVATGAGAAEAGEDASAGGVRMPELQGCSAAGTAVEMQQVQPDV